MTPPRRRHRRQGAGKAPTAGQSTGGELPPDSPAARYAAFKASQSFTSSRVGRFSRQYPFDLDSFQVEACQALDADTDVLVAAPTASGKTLVAEFGVYLACEYRVRLFYATPIKALSNQKYKDLCAQVGADKVGLLTGDTSINGEAQIVVMTTEVLRNMLYARSGALQNLGYVVLDEVHYLADRFRGPVWEEIIINLPPSVRVISLSATVSNAEDFGRWLRQVRGQTKVVVSEKRPTPLYQHMLVENKLYDLYLNAPRLNPELLIAARSLESKLVRRRGRFVGKLPVKRLEVAQTLEKHHLLPAIVFIFSRAGCEEAVSEVVNRGVCLTTPQEAEEIRLRAETALASLGAQDLSAVGGAAWIYALSCGVAAHHAGMLPVMKETVEELFSAGLIRLVYATETLALGVNMPARTVVLEQCDKWNGSEHAPLSAGEYTQLTGRAGRRGIDREGHALVLYSPQVPPPVVAALASKRTYPLHSAFRPTYNMAVNLLAYQSLAQAKATIEQSFAQFEATQSVSKLISQLRKAEAAAGHLADGAQCSKGNILELLEIMAELSKAEKYQQSLRRSSHNTPAEREAARAEIDRLRAQMKAHPCYQCQDRDDHLSKGRAAQKSLGSAASLRRRIELRTNTLSTQFGRITKVLQDFEYLDAECGLLAGGTLLRSIYADRDLLVAQCLREGIWDNLSTAALAGALAAAVYSARSESSFSAYIPAGISAPLASALGQMARLNHQIQVAEEANRLPISPNLDSGLCAAMEAWANGKNLSAVLEISDLTPGDFVRWCRQVIDLADQVTKANPDEQLRLRARAVINATRRGVVAW